MNHEAGGIPQVVIYQAINFTLFAILLYVLLKNKVVTHFADRRKEYLAAVTKFEHAKAEAEKKTAELRVRMQSLESSATDSVQQAKSEAAQLQSKIVSEAQAASQKMQQEAKRTVDAEVARAIRDLREEVLRQATEAARQVMQQQIKEGDQQRLQKEFVEKIQVVQQ
ncbi:MAG: ATP synthase F0 subunit B [Bdellovibrionia bacterium]